MSDPIDRRAFLRRTGAVAAVALLTPELWRSHLVSAATLGPGPYGGLGAPDANGVRLAAGFTARVIATTGLAVAGTSYLFHEAPDGGACFAVDDGWIYVSSSEVGNAGGGASAIRFGRDGSIRSAYRILSGTNRNCSGGATPWGTYLSCEEAGSSGRVYECDPTAPGQGVRRPLLGAFNHEAAAVDPRTGEVYLTEDDPAGRLYKFVPTRIGDLTAGQLYAASVANGVVTWVPTSSDRPDRQASTTPFDGGEGIYFAGDVIYFATKGDVRVWELDLPTNRLTVMHDAKNAPVDNLNAVDAVTVHGPSGDLYVAEDGGNMEIGIIGTVAGVRQCASFLRLDGHSGSEITGLAFSPDGTRLYFASQRGTDNRTGVLYEVTGPFRSGSGSGGTTHHLSIDRDTYAWGGTHAGTGYGAHHEVHVCANADEQYTRIGYLSVDTSTVGSVSAATLTLKARMSSGGPSTVRVHAVDAGWTESTLTWSSRPTIGPEIGRFTATDTTDRTYTVDVSSHVRAERAAGRTRVAFALVQDAIGPVVVVSARGSSIGGPVLSVSSEATPPGGPVTILANRDTFVRGRVGPRYGGRRLLRISSATRTNDTRQAFVNVDTSRVTGAVTSAVLRLNARSTGAVPQVVDVYACASDWSEATLGWANRPALGALLGSVTVTQTTVQELQLDITDHVRTSRAAAKPDISVALVQRQVDGPLLEVHAREVGASGPSLVIT